MEYREPYLHQKFLYWFTKKLALIVFKTVWRLETLEKGNVPRTGGVLLASNHISLADPPLVGSPLNRPVFYFAKEELFRYPVFGWYIRQLNAFPVKRYEHDLGAFKRAQTLLQNGQAVLLFPEGTRSKTGDLGKAKAGVAMLAYKAKVPVLPVYIHNSNKMKNFGKVRVAYGKPIFPPEVANEKEYYQEFSERVMGAIADLKSKMYNDFQ